MYVTPDYNLLIIWPANKNVALLLVWREQKPVKMCSCEIASFQIV